MDKKGPIVLIDDDADDLDFFQLAFSGLNLTNELARFDSAEKALKFLCIPEVNPFVIICDVNMPGMNGMELRDVLFNTPELKEKAIPFIFFTTAANKETVREAYKLPVQGVFEKPSTSAALQKRISLMIGYWNDSMML